MGGEFEYCCAFKILSKTNKQKTFWQDAASPAVEFRNPGTQGVQ